MAGVRHGDVVLVDPADPRIKAMLEGNPPLLVPKEEQ